MAATRTALLAIGRAVAPPRAPALVRPRRRTRATRSWRSWSSPIAPAGPAVRRSAGRRRCRPGLADARPARADRRAGVPRLAVLRWRNEEYVVTTRRVLQVEGVLNKQVGRQLAREDQRRGPDRVDLRPDVRLRRPRHPDRVRERDRAAPDAARRRRLQAGDARREARARARAVGRPADAVAAAPGRRRGRRARRRRRRRPRPPPRRPHAAPTRHRRAATLAASPTCATAARSAPRSTRRRSQELLGRL